MAQVLFLLSKTFPYGSGEQYIANELPFLSAKFDRVHIYPADWFGKDQPHDRVLPENVTIFNFNQELQPQEKNLLEALRLVFSEMLHAPSLFKELRRFGYLLGVAKHQVYTAANFLEKLRRDHAGDEVIFYCYWLHTSAIMLTWLKTKKHISSFVARAHSIDLYHHDWPLAEDLKVPPFENTKIRGASAIFPVSRHGEDFLQKKHRGSAQKIRHAYLGVSDRGQNNKTSQMFTIVTCANLSDNKRMLELARALREIEFPFKWVHFGEGPQRPEIEAIAKTLPAGRSIELRGQSLNERVRAYLVEEPVNLFVNLSRVEGLPVSLMEAASAGIPMVATATNGSPEIVQDHKTGWLLPVEFTVPQLAQLLQAIYSDPQKRVLYGSNARKLYLERFNSALNYGRFAEELLNYKNILV